MRVTNDEIVELWEEKEAVKECVENWQIAKLFDRIDELYALITDDTPPRRADDERAAFERWGTAPTPAYGPHSCTCDRCKARNMQATNIGRGAALALAKTDLESVALAKADVAAFEPEPAGCKCERCVAVAIGSPTYVAAGVLRATVTGDAIKDADTASVLRREALVQKYKLNLTP